MSHLNRRFSNKFTRLKQKITLRKVNRSGLGQSMMKKGKTKSLLTNINKFSRRIQGKKAVTDWRKFTTGGSRRWGG